MADRRGSPPFAVLALHSGMRATVDLHICEIRSLLRSHNRVVVSCEVRRLTLCCMAAMRTRIWIASLLSGYWFHTSLGGRLADSSIHNGQLYYPSVCVVNSCTILKVYTNREHLSFRWPSFDKMSPQTTICRNNELASCVHSQCFVSSEVLSPTGREAHHLSEGRRARGRRQMLSQSKAVSWVNLV